MTCVTLHEELWGHMFCSVRYHYVQYSVSDESVVIQSCLTTSAEITVLGFAECSSLQQNGVVSCTNGQSSDLCSEMGSLYYQCGLGQVD